MGQNNNNPRIPLTVHRFACMALLLLLSGLTWPTLASPAQDTHPVIRVGFYDFPPYSYEDRQGRAQGSLLALTQRLLEQAGYRAELRMLPVARLYAGLQNGSVHVWPGAPGKPELQGYTLESRHRLGHIGLHLYFRADTAPPALPHGLTGRGLILISGYSYWAPYSQWLTDPSLQLQLHRTSSHAAALAMLQRQRGDFILDYQEPLEQHSQQAGVLGLRSIELQRLPLTLVVSRRAPQAERLLEQLDQAYQQLQEAGADLQLPADHSSR